MPTLSKNSKRSEARKKAEAKKAAAKAKRSTKKAAVPAGGATRRGKTGTLIKTGLKKKK